MRHPVAWLSSTGTRTRANSVGHADGATILGKRCSRFDFRRIMGPFAKVKTPWILHAPCAGQPAWPPPSVRPSLLALARLPCRRPLAPSMAFPAPIPVSLALSPVEAFLAWPRQVPVLALWSGSGLIAQPAAGDVNADPEARWTVLGIPSSWRMLQHGASATDVRAFLRGLSPFAEPLADPAPAARDSTPSAATVAASTLVPGWFLRVSYEVGEALEPATTRQGPAAAASSAPASAPTSARWPLAEAARVDQALIFDHAQNQWYAVGHARRLVALVTDAPATAERFELGALTSQWGEAGYQGAVRDAIELIHAGDCYQVNLAHAMKAPFAGSTRALFTAMCRRAAPWHGAYMERDESDGTRRALLSISPELFLAYDATSRTIATRPMKGTRRAGDGVGDGVGDAAGDARRDLEHSVKDHAELAMIVDMMRNDLGRSAELGSVRVDAPRRIEHHGTGAGAVLQATGLVRATLREGVELADAIADAFPPASVTGAPKIRAMQIIRELEPSRRDAYCGCIGMRSDHGDLALNVAIRTAMIHGRIDGTPGAGEARDIEPRDAAARDSFGSATLTYHVGAGIVADSDPSAEWRETLDKAGHIAAIADSSHSTITAARAPSSSDQGGHS